jgi:mono/diheme cytochrome c family protein
MSTMATTTALLVLALAANARGNGPDAELAAKAHGILKQYCARCHGVRFEVPGFDVLDRDALVAAPPAAKKRKKPYVVPGKADESLIWKRVGDDQDMPPEDPSPSDDERAILKAWIEAGAPFPEASRGRPFLADKEVLTAIRDDLIRTPSIDRPFRRYLTIANLQNDPRVLDADLRLTRAAVAKLLNSLSQEPKIAEVRPIDKAEAILAIDLRTIGWDRPDRFRELLKRYPYALKHDPDQDRELADLARDVAMLAGTPLPYVRADWFVNTASRPPLYETLLRLPNDAGTLERSLHVDTRGDFLRDRLARAGFAASGVSSQNRLVDRHPSPFGAYWKSYDFKSDDGPGNILRFPLGPEFAGNPFPRQAFRHAGGEIIFNLPNGLQGYLLVNNQDQRIENGPIEIVGDSLKTAGTAAIVNGLSCMACHQEGVKPFKDSVRSGSAVAGEALEKLGRLYPTREAMDKLLAEDQERFLRALEAATGPLLQVAEDQDRPIRDFPEPIGAVARRYQKDLGLADAARELGLDDPNGLAAAIRSSSRLRTMGLGPLARGEVIKRAVWDSLETHLSTFQRAARELERGTPLRIN